MNALGISCTVEEGVLVVGIELESASYLLFQKGVEEATGKDELSYFEYGDQSLGGYGLVKRCTLSDGELSVVLGKPLGGDSELRVVLGPETRGLSCLAEQLPKVFVNEAGVFECVSA